MPVKREPYCLCAHPVSWHKDGTGKCSHGCGCEKVERRRRGRTPAAPEAPLPEAWRNPHTAAKTRDVGALVQVLEQLGATAIAAARELRKVAGVLPNFAQARPEPARRAPRILAPPKANSSAPTSSDFRPKSPGHGDGLAAGELRVLAAIVQYPEGITREHLTVLTGYKKSTRDLYIQRLHRLELVALEAGRVVATPAGVRARGPFEPLPTGGALRDYWLDRLPEGEAVILEALAHAWPQSVARAALEQSTGYKKSTRDLYLQRLIRRELVEDTGPGLVCASDLLFDARKASA